MVIRLCGYLVTWLSDYMVIWLFGYMVIWLHGYLIIWLYGYLVIWLYSYMVIWLYGHMVIMVIWLLCLQIFVVENFHNFRNYTVITKILFTNFLSQLIILDTIGAR